MSVLLPHIELIVGWLVLVSVGSSGGPAVPCGGPAKLQRRSPQCPGHEPTAAATQSSGGRSTSQTLHDCHGVTGEDHVA